MLIPNHIKSAIRFRQWKRKSYAVFLSIGKHVTIGNVKSIVADTLLPKNKTVIVYNPMLLPYSECSFEEADDPPQEQNLLQAATVILQKNNVYGEQHLSPLPFCTQWLKLFYASISAIFILSDHKNQFLKQQKNSHEPKSYRHNRFNATICRFQNTSTGTIS